LILVSLVSFSSQKDGPLDWLDDVLAYVVCYGNELVTKTRTLVTNYSKKEITAVQVVTEVFKDVHDVARDITSCLRYDVPNRVSNFKLNGVGKLGYIMLNRSPCERDIGITLIWLQQFITEAPNDDNFTEKVVISSLVALLNSGFSYGTCKKEIETLIQIWQPTNTAVVEDNDCLGHIIGEELSVAMRNNRFLDNSIMEFFKVATDLYSSVIMCEKEKTVFGTTNLSPLAKIGWSIIDRSKCERSLGTVLILIDKVSQKETSVSERALKTLLSADVIFMSYFNCAEEIKLIFDLIKN